MEILFFNFTNNTLTGGYSGVSLAYAVTIPSQFRVSGIDGVPDSNYRGVRFDNKFYIESGATIYVFPVAGNGTSIFDVKRTSNNSTVATNVSDSYEMPAYDITLVFKSNKPFIRVIIKSFGKW